MVERLVKAGNLTSRSPNVVYADKIKKSSKAITADFNQIDVTTRTGEIQSEERLSEVIQTIIDDEELRAFYSIIRDAVVRSGGELKGSASMVKKGDDLLKQVRFRKKLKRIIFDAIVFKHAFVEIEMNALKTKVVNIHVLDPNKLHPKKDEHDRILGWIMERPDGTIGDDITWKEEEIAHFVIDEMTPTFWGKTDLHTLKEIISMKKAVMEHIKILFEQNYFRIHFHGKNVGEADLDQFVDMFMTAQYDKSAPLITIGTEDMEGKKYVQETILLPLIEMLHELRNKMLTLIRVPPIIAGTVDNSNRSNSDIQAHFSFLNRIQSIQEDLEDDMEYELLPKMGLNNLSYKFNQSNNRDLKEIIDISILLITAGAKRDVVVKWLRNKGYDLPEDLFPEITEEETKELLGVGLETGTNENGSPKGGNTNESKLPENSDLKRSRKKQDKANTDGFGIGQK